MFAQRLPRFGLIGVLGVTSLILVVVLAMALGGHLRSQVRKRALSDARRTGELVIRLGVERSLTQDDLNSGLSSRRVQALDQVLSEATTDGEIAGVKILNLQTEVVYSDDRSLVGRNLQQSDELAEATEGHTTAKVAESADKDQRGKSDSINEVLVVYVPIRSGSADAVIGVLELQLPYDAEGVATGTRTVYVVVGALYIALLYVVAGLWRKFKRRTEEKEAKVFREATTKRKQAEATLGEGAARYRAIFSGAAVGIVLSDMDGRIVESNPAFQDMLGYGADELRGRILGDLTHSRDVGEDWAFFEDLSSAKRTHYQVEKRYVRKDGTVLWGHMTGSLVRTSSGKPHFFIAMVQNITERRQAEEQTRRYQAFLNSVVENIPNMIFVKDAENLTFVSLNRAGEELTGFSRDDVLGKSDHDLLLQKEADISTAQDREVLEKGELVDIPDERVRTKHKGERILHTKKIPILNPQGRPQYILGISEDITERRLTEEAIRQAKEEAERANRAKSEFLSRMSHELRTPLNAILGFGQLLEVESLSREQEEGVEHILKAGRHLLELINEVLDLTSIESGRLPLSLEPVLVADALQESLDLIRPLASDRRVTLEGEFSEHPPVHALADRQRLNQVLLNLMANAIKYNREDGRVTLSVERLSESTVRINVEDTGPGISPANMDRLFNPFDRLDAEISGVEGTGLGLALSKRLIESMEGTIGVASEVGRGSTFWVELPIVESPFAGLANLEERAQISEEPNAAPRHVLYIEDNLSNLELVQRILTRRPEIKLIPAMQGGLGLDLAREHHPDLILLDLHLPDIPGEEVLRRLRDDPQTRDIEVVVISADATPSQIDRLLAADVHDYLTKPLDVQRFLAVLDESLMEGSH